MTDQWFYARGTQQSGPVSFAQLAEVARVGGMTPEDLVWEAGTPDWKPARQVPGLFPAPPAAPASNVPNPALPAQAHALPYAHNVPQPNASFEDDARNAMICAIIGLFVVGFVLGPMGIVMGNRARRNMRASGNMAGDGMALAGIIIGWIVLAFNVLSIGAVILIWIAMSV